MVVIKYDYHLHWRCFGTTCVFSTPLLVTNYSMSATSYFVAFWQWLTLSVPCREHHSFTSAGCEVHAEFICWKSQISDSDTDTSLSLNHDKIPRDHPITKIWAGLFTWGSKISDLHGISNDYFFLKHWLWAPALSVPHNLSHPAGQPHGHSMSPPKHQGSSVPRNFQSTSKLQNNEIN